jgi:hypothetical protein
MLVDPSLWPRTNSFRRTEPDLSVDVRFWHECDIARSRMDVCFRGKSGRAADITGTTEFDPIRS